MGKGSRSQVKTYISKGRVTVNGEIIKRPEYKISPEKDIVNLEGEKVNYSRWEYYMLNKPAGCVSATEDKHFPTVVSFIEDAARKDLFPVGRLHLMQAMKNWKKLLKLLKQKNLLIKKKNV